MIFQKKFSERDLKKKFLAEPLSRVDEASTDTRVQSFDVYVVQPHLSGSSTSTRNSLQQLPLWEMLVVRAGYVAPFEYMYSFQARVFIMLNKIRKIDLK